ncbi:MAG TPA: Tad domain-containing protein [Chloroflexota bacterium]|nr:Tad domain-containing protein [Chloroflexota bacterium]
MTARLLRRLLRRQDGAIAATAALCMVMFIGCLGLVMDGGQMYIQRTQLQKVVDAAALAGAYDIGLNGNSAADAAAYAKLNQFDPSSDPNSSLLTNGPATIFAANDAWTVTAQRHLPLAFAPLLGMPSATIKATATAINSPAKSIDTSVLMPWAVWGGNSLGGSDPLGLNVGDLAVFRVNDYKAANVLPNPCDDIKGPPCNKNWQIGDNAFKGYFHDFTGILTQNGAMSTSSKGGNACGQEPIDKLTSLGNTPGIFPVISTASGGGGNNNFTILGFVALKIDSTSCGGGQMDGVVQRWTTWQAQAGGGTIPGLPSVTVLKLWQ